MPTTVADLTPEELRAMIEEVVRDQLADILGDPDEGLEVRPELVAQLREQMKKVREGELGTPFAEIPRPL